MRPNNQLNARWALSVLGSGVIVMALCLLSPVDLQAQTLYGSLVGNVTDQTGAAVPGVDVTATNQQTNVTQTTISSEIGAFSFPTLRPGLFTLKASMPGFKEFVVTDIPITVNNVTRRDIKLEVGAVTEIVTVTSETAILQTDRAEVRSEITAEKFENLPVPIGRNYQNLFKTIAGITPPSSAHSIQTNPSRSLTFNTNGVSNSINTTRIDGATSTNPWLPHITGYVPSLDAIETVNVVTNSYDAEQGLAGGAAVSVQLKSGTNDFGGTAFFTHHSNALRAKQFIYPYPTDQFGTPLRKGKFIYNQWGATFGGPAIKDKLFFFASYEGTGNYRYASRVGTVPSATVRSGDMKPIGKDVYDPFTGNLDGTEKVQFPDNVIPQDRFDPIALKLLSKLPLPNIGGREDTESNNYYGEGRFTWDRWTLDTKVDYIVNEKFNMFGRLSLLDYNVEQPTIFGNDNLLGDGLRSHGAGGGNPGTGQGTTKAFSYGANYIFTPTLILDGNFGFSRFVTDSRNPFYGVNVGSDELGIPGTNGGEIFETGIPRFDLSTYNDFGNTQSYMPYYRSDDNWQYVVNMTWTKGVHQIRFGLDLNRQDMNHIQPEGGVGMGSRGRFYFRDNALQLCLEPEGDGINCKQLSSATGRMSFGSFLLGVVDRAGKNTLTEAPYHTRNPLQSFYIRDRWQVTPRFTLSIGTRYEYYPIPTRGSRGMEIYDIDTNRMILGGVGGNPKDMGVSVSKKLFAPRIGIAYRATDDFVIRMGYGLTIDPYPIARELRTNHPVFIETDLRAPNGWSYATTLQQGIPPIIPPEIASDGTAEIPGNVFAVTLPDRFQRGYIQSWNLTLQKELPLGFTGEIGYVATRSIQQLGRWELNFGQIGGGSASRALYQKWGRDANTRMAPFPIGNAQYDSMQIVLKRRFADGFSMDVNYTLGKIMSDNGQNDSDSGMKIQIPEYIHLNRQIAEHDRTHNLEIQNIWELPFGPGRRWSSDNGFLSALISGWQTNSIISWYSGTPFDVDNPNTLNSGGGSDQRPDLVGPIRKLGGIGPGQPYYDPSAFREVEEQRFGTAGYGILRGAPTFNWDFGLFRNFGITEDVNLQFRMEAFNFTNTPHYNNPENDVDDSQFMIIDDADDERQFRFTLRLEF